MNLGIEHVFLKSGIPTKYMHLYVYKYGSNMDNLHFTSINKIVFFIITYIAYIYTFINIIVFKENSNKRCIHL